jgi:DNA mismatch endonuclease (patch repair protein)
MTDNHSEEQRSYNMSQIRSTNTKIELDFKKLLIGTRLRYQPRMLGKPDFGSKKNKIAVFIDGCFWHKCPKCYRRPKSNRKFWIAKVERNIKRDKFINRELKSQNYKVMRFWEHQIKRCPDKYAQKVIFEVKKGDEKIAGF